MSGVYRVKGARGYRGHHPGTVFEVTLSHETERRAIQRGAIELVTRYTPALPEDHTFPRGWLVANSTDDSRR